MPQSTKFFCVKKRQELNISQGEYYPAERRGGFWSSYVTSYNAVLR